MKIANGRLLMPTIVRTYCCAHVALTVILATAAKATIVEIVGSAVPNTLNSSLAGHTPANPFYAEKISAGGSNCAGQNHGQGTANCPLSTLLQSINEQQQIILSSPVATSKPNYQQGPAPAGYGWQSPGPTIPAGQSVNSHYIWLNAPTTLYPSHDIAKFKFDGPILGVIGKPEDLVATNGALGFDITTAPAGSKMVSYTPTGSTSCAPQPFCFVNEEYPNNPADPAHGIPISGDIVFRVAPAILIVDFTSFSGDYIRVVTAADVPLHPGDFDHDYDVDDDDYAIWRGTYGSTDDLRADADNSGQVDGADYVVWRHNKGYAYTFPGFSGSELALQLSSDVPEPECSALLSMGLFCRALVPRTRRR